MSDSTVTFVNVIDVEPARQQELIELLKEGTENAVSQLPGFVSVTLFASKDKTRVLNVAKWRSPADAQAAQSNPAAAEYASRVGSVATPSPGLFDVVGEYHRR
jgi:heme-degrading monooxygenase HmoA